MDKSPTTITVICYRKWGAASYLRAMAFCVMPVGLGILTGSAAMQWLGFLITIVVSLAAAKNSANASTAISIDAARKVLDDLEAEKPPA